MGLLEERIEDRSLLGRVMPVEEAVTRIKNRMTLGVSGFTKSGETSGTIPKATAFPAALSSSFSASKYFRLPIRTSTCGLSRPWNGAGDPGSKNAPRLQRWLQPSPPTELDEPTGAAVQKTPNA